MARGAGENRSHFLVRHLERLPLGTPYPGVADRIARITDQVRARTGERPTVFVDATGVGTPVVDLLRERVQSGEVVAAWFTYGGQRAESWEGDFLRASLGKAFMVSRLQALLGSGRMHLEAMSRILRRRQLLPQGSFLGIQGCLTTT